MLKINIVWAKILFIIYAALWGAEAYLSFSTNYRYMVLMVLVALLALLLYCTGQRRPLVTAVFKQMNIIFAVFLFISLYAMFFNGFKFFASRDIIQLYFPAVLAFLIYNMEPDGNMDFYFEVLLWTQALPYLYWVLRTITVEKLLSIGGSYSPWESIIATRFTVLMLYYYLRKKPVRCAGIFFLNYLAFKRMNIIYVFGLVLFGWALKKVRVTDRLLNITKLAFIVSPFVLHFLVSPAFINWYDSTFEETFQQFTMARSDQFIYVLNYEGSLLGLGSTNVMLQRTYYIPYFHSDILRLYIETSLPGMCVFVNGMFNMVKIRRDIYAYSLMVFFFFMMFGSVQIGDFLGYTGLFLICQIDFKAVNEAEALKKSGSSAAGKRYLWAAPEAY